MSQTPKSLPRRAFDVLASYELAIVVLLLLFLLTVIGTLEQVNSSLYEVQKRYFESAFVVHRIGFLPLPLPGVSLLLCVLVVNLVCGGIVRIRKNARTIGVIVAHVGILAMVAGSAVEFLLSQKGHTTLAEGDTSAEFVSYFDWEIAVAEPANDGPVTEFVIPGERFMGLRPGQVAEFTTPELPFELVVHDVHPNCGLQDGASAETQSVDGVALKPRGRDKEAEREIAGAYVTIRPKAGGEPQQGLLWAMEQYPLSSVVDGRRFTIGLQRRRWPLPFDVRLDDFRKVDHPGMGMAKAFESDVTKFESGVPQKIKISMNAPLRHKGYTLFQSGFSEPDKSMSGRWESTFSVVRNPADQVPLWSCLVIGAGLVFHFAAKLVRHVRSGAREKP